MPSTLALLAESYIIDEPSATLRTALCLERFIKNDLIWMYGRARLPNVLDYRASWKDDYALALAERFGQEVESVTLEEFVAICDRANRCEALAEK